MRNQNEDLSILFIEQDFCRNLCSKIQLHCLAISEFMEEMDHVMNRLLLLIESEMLFLLH